MAATLRPVNLHEDAIVSLVPFLSFRYQRKGYRCVGAVKWIERQCRRLPECARDFPCLLLRNCFGSGWELLRMDAKQHPISREPAMKQERRQSGRGRKSPRQNRTLGVSNQLLSTLSSVIAGERAGGGPSRLPRLPSGAE